MSLRGDAVIAIWQDLVPEAKEDFREWHNRQHVPERLSIPGFLRARRLVALQGGPEFYTLYELDQIDTATSNGYLNRLNAPTEWTQRIMPKFRNMARSACSVVFSAGLGDGGFMMTVRVSGVPGLLDTLPLLMRDPGIVSVHWCAADNSASGIETKEKAFRSSADLIPEYVAMVEGTSPENIRDAVARLRLKDADIAIYRLEHCAAKDDVETGPEPRGAGLEHARGVS